MLKRFGRICVLAVGFAALSVACDEDDHTDVEGVPTGSTCPTTQTLTYANFGQAFFDSYCQRCHASTVTGAARMGAPSDHTFDMKQDIQLLSEHIDELAAAGPDAVNIEMPPDGAKPTEAERRQLGEWLACGAP
jgi:cytochrome c5